MNTLSENVSGKWLWLPGLSALMAIIACKGMILLIALFPLLGFTLAINATVQAAVISLFALLTPLLIIYHCRRRQVRRIPIVVSIVGALMVVSSMYIHFNVMIESIGLAALFISALWSWSAGKASAKAIEMA